MKTIANITALLMIAIGIIWFLQGINVLPGSFMSGQSQWAIYGALLFAAGLGWTVVLRRRS